MGKNKKNGEEYVFFHNRENVIEKDCDLKVDIDKIVNIAYKLSNENIGETILKIIEEMEGTNEIDILNLCSGKE